jgi:hypothetical protein
MKLLIFIFLVTLSFFGCERPTETDDGDNNFPPAVPQGLLVYYASDGEIGIEWNADRVGNIRGYNIYRSNEDSGYTFIEFTNRFYFIDDSLYYDSVYFYRVSAVNTSFIESELSASVSAKPINRYTPRTPGALFINARNWPDSKGIFLSWLPNEETDLAGYRIFKSDTENFEPDESSYLSSITATEFADTTVSQLYQRFYYKIKAFDKGGLESDPSPERSDVLLGEPLLLVPGPDSQVSGFSEFSFLTSGEPAVYKLIVQSSPYFGELWQTDITTSAINDTVKVRVPGGVFYYNTPYYWRVASFTVSEQPNSVSQLNKFMIVR